MASIATKVLVVDDDPDLQEILGICLRQWGFEVARAANGNEGARLAESYHPDIVLSDVMMPDTSGIDLLKSLLSKEPGRPVILMTGYSTADLAAAALKDGALDLLTKPLDYRKLKLILETSQRDLKSSDESREEQPWGQAMVLVALTGWGQEEDRRRSREAGFNHHLTKPIHPHALTNLLRLSLSPGAI